MIKPDLFSWSTHPALRGSGADLLHQYPPFAAARRRELHVQGLQTCSLIDLINKIIDGKSWVSYYQLQGQLLGHTQPRLCSQPLVFHRPGFTPPWVVILHIQMKNEEIQPNGCIYLLRILHCLTPWYLSVSTPWHLSILKEFSTKTFPIVLMKKKVMQFNRTGRKHTERLKTSTENSGSEFRPLKTRAGDLMFCSLFHPMFFFKIFFEGEHWEKQGGSCTASQPCSRPHGHPSPL